jgi:hypothetical protein
MSALATINDKPAATHAKASKDAKILRVTGKNRAAIDAMVWEGLKRSDAAQKAGLKDHALYVALTKPHVKAYYMQQLDVLRTSERARNIHTLTDVRDQTSNQMARVHAVKVLEQIGDDEQAARGVQAMPGLQIVIVQGPATRIAADTSQNQVIDMIEDV